MNQHDTIYSRLPMVGLLCCVSNELRACQVRSCKRNTWGVHGSFRCVFNEEF